MARIYALILLLISTNLVAAEEVANCNTALTGYEFYTQENKLEKGGVSNFHLSAIRTDDTNYDVLYMDVTGKIKSAKSEGGLVTMLEKSPNSFALMVRYTNVQTDIYTFTKSKLNNTFVLQTVRNGKIALFPKNNLLTGSCNKIQIPN